MITPIESAWHSITSTISRIASAISNGLHSAWNAVKNIGSLFASIGSDIVSGIVSGVEGAAGSLFSSLKNLASSALSSAKSFLGIGSPSKLFRDQVGKWIAHGVAQGVDDYTQVAVSSVRGMAASVAGVPFGTAGIGGSGLTAAGGGLSYMSGAGAGGGTVVIDLRGAQVMSDADMKKLADKIGAQMPRALASAGVRIRA
jgi:phage-related protein